MTNYKLGFLKTTIKTSKKGNQYVEFNFVLNMKDKNGKDFSLSGFTISAKDIVDFANNRIEIMQQYISKKEVGEKVYFNYDLSKQRADQVEEQNKIEIK